MMPQEGSPHHDEKPTASPDADGPKASGKSDRSRSTLATIDVRATERFLRWSLKRNQQAIDALTHQREALEAALEVVTRRGSNR